MVEERSLTVEYALTRGEIFRSFLHSVAESPRYRATILLYSGAIGLLTLLLRAVISRSLTLTDAISAVAWAAGLPVFIALWVFIRGKTDLRTLTVSPIGISTEIGRLKAQIPWDKVKLVSHTSKFVLIAGTNGNAFFVPDRAFSSLEQRDQFLAEIRSWMQAST